MDATPAPQVWPTLRANDARALIRFLVEAFGFEETVVYGEGETVHHAPAVLAARRRDHARLDPRGRQGGRLAAAARQLRGPYVVTDDPDGLCARAKAAGAPITMELHETDYGSRDFAARDPEGKPVVVRHLPRRTAQGRGLTRDAGRRSGG